MSVEPLSHASAGSANLPIRLGANREIGAPRAAVRLGANQEIGAPREAVCFAFTGQLTGHTAEKELAHVG